MASAWGASWGSAWGDSWGALPVTTRLGGDGAGERSPSRRRARRLQSLQNNEALRPQLVPVTKKVVARALKLPEAAGWRFTEARAALPPLLPIEVPSPIRPSAVTATMVALAVAKYLEQVRAEQDEEDVMVLLASVA